MIKKPNNSGWILCPSKSYPGKFYYFNVLNGDAAWCLNEKEKKVLKKDFTIQKVNENHLYPEPVTPPNHPSPRGFNYNRTIPTCFSQPTFGKAVFPTYIANEKEDMNIVCTPIQMLQLVNNTKKKLDQNTQTEYNTNVPTHTIPLTKRFGNKTNEGFGSINSVVANQPKDWWTSTNLCSNIGKQCRTHMQYKHKIFTKPKILKESKLNKLQCKNKKDVWCKSAKQDSIQFHCNKVKNPKANMLINLDISDLRYVLRAKRRKSFEISDVYNKVNEEHSTFNDAKKVTLNIKTNNTFRTEEKYESEESPYTNNENQQVCYLVVDLDVLLEDYDIINRYIDKDENCRLYVPSVVHKELKSLCMEEHNMRSRVIAARKLLRHLGSNLLRLNIPENNEDTKIHQIINCCLEIIKRNCNVVLVTKNNELIYTAKLYEIEVYHINYIKSNDIDNIFLDTNKNNLFLQDTDDFDPFSLSKIARSENNCTQNISVPKESLFHRVSHTNVNSSDVSEIIISISKLNINDKIPNIKRKVKNNLFENKIVRSNYNFPTFQNINVAESNSREIIVNRTLNNKRININLDNPENYRNMNLITKSFNFDNNDTNNIFEGMLEEFHIKNYTMENNIYVRFDEWLCFYEQILEEFLYIILQKNLEQVHQPPPWFLHEGLECLKEIYRNNKYIINIIEKLLYYYEFSENGANIKPYNFMKLFGCGFYLVEALEKTSPLCISDIKDKLIYLKDMLECPVEDLIADTPITYNPEDKQTDRYNSVKNHSDVLDYLKKHFSEWKNYNEDCDTNQMEHEVHEVQERSKRPRDNIKVVRTYGRDLKQFTISKSKCLSFIKETDTHNDIQSNVYPKVIRNITLLDKYEEKIKNKENCLDYPEMAETDSSISLNNENNIINRVAENNDCEIVSLNNDFSINDINDSTRDSGFDSNSLQAYHLVRNFLSELCSSFKTIHTFIEESIKAYSEDIPEEYKKEFYEKATKTHTYLTKIIEKLKIIIQRESVQSSSLKALLINAGKDDTRTTRYRPVVMKCLEQATILENSLKLLLAITNEEVLSESSDENIPFINIYE